MIPKDNTNVDSIGCQNRFSNEQLIKDMEKVIAFCANKSVHEKHRQKAAHLYLIHRITSYIDNYQYSSPKLKLSKKEIKNL